jgi:hypothetical protein
MKNIFKIIIFLTVGFGNIYSQNSFQKLYTQIGDNAQVKSCYETSNGFLLGYTEGYYNILTDQLKINKTGGFEWNKRLPNSSSFATAFNKFGQYAVIEQNEPQVSDYFLSIYDSSSGLISKTSLKDADPSNFNLSYLSDDSILLVYKSGTESINTIVEKRSSLGNIIWSKIFPINVTGFAQNRHSTEDTEGNIMFSYRNNLFKLSSDGESSWTIKLEDVITNLLSTDGNKILAVLKNLNSVLIAPDGSVLWTKSLKTKNNFSALTATKNNIITAEQNENGSMIYTYNLSGEKTDSFYINQDITFIKGISGSRLLLAGSHNLNVYNNHIKGDFGITATDNNGNLPKGIEIFFPNFPEQITTDEDIAILWLSTQVNSVDISYSSDNGTTWNLIEQNVSAEKKYYFWNLPYKNISSLLIKISDSDNQDFYDISDFPSNIVVYDSYDYIAANECFMWVGNNGMGSNDPKDYDSGFFWPGGSMAVNPLIFKDGLVWGGIIDGQLKANGNYYKDGLQPGSILSTGLADNPVSVRNKIYKIKKGWQQLPENEEKDKYRFNYENWPVELGAPWIDTDSDGLYTKGVDKPKFMGDETLFYVANDLDTALSNSSLGSDPIGLEFRTLVYASSDEDKKNFVIKDYTIINKSGKTIEDMFFGYWSDDDLGFGGDDFSGCDTSLSMMYTYNGDDFDEDTYFDNIPSVGHMFLKGPYNNVQDTTFKMTAFININKSIPYLGDPILHDYRGTETFYNYLRGLDNLGSTIINPAINKQTRFMYSGDPVNKEGWFMGSEADSIQKLTPADRRFVMSSGPFNFQPGDTQHVVIAILVAQGENRLNGIIKLKEYAQYIQNLWQNNLITDAITKRPQIVQDFSLSQNYPNPFNPTTTIEYTIPGFESGNRNPELVSLIVYDILGRKVGTIVNEKQKPGKYSVAWNASKYSSGIYFYKLSAGKFIQTRKMVLIK